MRRTGVAVAGLMLGLGPLLSIHAGAAAPGASVGIVEPNASDRSTWTYNPTSISVGVGTTITWTNAGHQVHSVAADKASSFQFSSPDLTPGQSYQQVFSKAGTFAYLCRQHPWMKATITVH